MSPRYAGRRAVARAVEREARAIRIAALEHEVGLASDGDHEARHCERCLWAMTLGYVPPSPPAATAKPDTVWR